MNSIYDVMKIRRSIYNLGNKEIIPQEKLVELINHAVKYCPSSFNSQSARVAVLFNKNHKKLWDITLHALKALTPEDKFAATKAKIKSFKDGYGTVLFFEDENVVKSLQNSFPLYKDNFPKWSEQSNGMLQYIVWVSLAEANVGASLQHYNPLIDAEVQKELNIPHAWHLIAQMPFGSIEAPAADKTFLPLEDRVKILD